MDHKSEIHKQNGVTVEVATIIHEGCEFSNLGAVIDHSAGYVAGYVAGSTLTNWQGEVIGSVRVISSRQAVFFGRRSWIGDRLYYFRATIDGIAYHGSGFGDGMLLKLRRTR